MLTRLPDELYRAIYKFLFLDVLYSIKNMSKEYYIENEEDYGNSLVEFFLPYPNQNGWDILEYRY